MNKPLMSMFTLMLAVTLAAGHALAITTVGSKLMSMPKAGANSATVPALDIQQWYTAEGARVLFVRTQEQPMFDLRLDFAAGSSRDGDKPGLAVLTNSMINEGIDQLNAHQLALALEGHGARYSNDVDKDYSTLSLRSLSAAPQREAALALFNRMIGQPSVPAAALEQVRQQQLHQLASDATLPFTPLQHALDGHLFTGHPYASPVFGDPQVVRRLIREEVLGFHARMYTAANLSITLVGDLEREQALSISAALSAGLPKGPAPTPLPAVPAATPEVIHLEKPGERVHVVLAMPAINRDHPDYAALLAGTTILGGDGMNNRLMQLLRTTHGITYGVTARLTKLASGSVYTIAWQTEPRYNQESQNAVEQLIREFLDNGPSQEEVDRIKLRLAGRYPQSVANNGQILEVVSSIARRNAPLDDSRRLLEATQALTPASVGQAMRRHFNADNLVYLSSGPTVPQTELPVLASD